TCGSETGETEVERCLSGFVPIVERLSDLFTTDRRTDFGSYGDDRRLLLAYGLFFYPQTYTRVQFPLLEASRRAGAFPKTGPLRVLDLGTGSGAALAGAVDSLLAMGQIEVEAHGVDASVAALDLARRLTSDERARWPGVSWSFAR